MIADWPHVAAAALLVALAALFVGGMYGRAALTAAARRGRRTA